jgi:DNA-binding NtrC family response regulator
MKKRAPLVLTASASADERHRLAAALKEGGFEVRVVDLAEEAEAEIRGHPGASVLVIDSGLLEMHHDGQWRGLCERHPSLATVVRCWAPKNPAVRSKERRQLRVHPDDPEGLLNAIRSFAATVG